MNIYMKLEVAEYLEDLANGDVVTQKELFGLCWHLNRRFDAFVRYDVMQLALDWPLHSGDTAYPIPCPHDEDVSPEWYYEETPNKWKGVAGELRRDLIRFLVGVLREDT